MHRATEGIRIAILLLALVLAGCQKSAPAPYPQFGTRASDRPPTGAFASLVDAAKKTEAYCPDSLSRTTFTPQSKRLIVEQLKQPLGVILGLRNEPVTFEYVPIEPFSVPPHRAGWNLLGKAIAWNVEQRAEEGDLDAAVQWFLAGTKFGFDLLGGNSRDATLGLAIVDGCRKAILPSFNRLSAKQLETLHAQLIVIDQNRPTLEVTFQNDEEDMLAVVQMVQTAYQTRSYDALRKNLGLDIEPAIEALDRMHAHDATERPKYFEAFAQEARQQAEFRLSGAKLDALARTKLTAPALSGDRPWRRFSRYFFRGLDAVFSIHDRTLARTRMLGLHAGLRAQVLTKGVSPTSLSGYPETFTKDPMNGLPFVLHVDGATYRLYSAGLDARDDGGETDPSFLAPDLLLESHEL